jgi:hypothetical protein
MNRILKTILFLFICNCAVEIPCAAQLIISKDYNACLYGVKNSDEKWIVKPEYSDIDPFKKNGCAIAKKNEKCGIIDDAGKILIPCIYDQIEFPYGTSLKCDYRYDELQRRFFIVRDDSRAAGVVDSTGKIVVPIKYNEIAPFGDTTIFAKDGEGNWFIYSCRGIFCGAVPETTDEPRFIMPNTNLITTGYMYSPPYGACDDHGKMTIPMIYDSVVVNTRNYLVAEAWKHDRVTLYDTNGKIINAENSEVDETYIANLSLVHNYGITPEKNSGKWGIINWKGEILFPFVYDTIQLLHLPQWWDTNPAKVFFLLKQNGKCGVADGMGKTILPCEYENLAWAIDDYYSDHEKQDSAMRFLFVKKNKKWGAVNTKGEFLMNCDYDTAFKITDSNFLFWKNGESVLLKINISSPEVACYTPWNEISGWAKLYRGDILHGLCEYTIPAKYNDKGLELSCISPTLVIGEDQYSWDPYAYGVFLDDRPVFEMQQINFTSPAKDFFLSTDSFNMRGQYDAQWSSFGIWQDKKNIFHLVQEFISDSIGGTWYTSTTSPYCLISEKGKVVMPAVLAERPWIFSASPWLFEVRSSRIGLCDTNGELVMDTAYYKIRKGPDGFAWADGDACSKNEINNCNCCWNLYDLKNKKNVFDTFHLVDECWYQENGTFPFSSTHGAGLFNSRETKIVLEPQYKTIVAVNYPMNYFFVEDCENKIGVADTNGKFVVPMIYDKVVLAEKPFYSSGIKTYRLEAHVLLNDSMALFIDTNGTIKQLDAETKLHLFNAAEKRATIIRASILVGDEANISPNVYSNGFHLNARQKIIVADSLYTGKYSPGYSQFFKKANCSCIVPEPNYGEGYRLPVEAPIFDYDIIFDETCELHILFRTDSILSVNQKNFYGNSHYAKENKEPYWTLIWYANGPRPASLDSLFINAHWKITISNEVMNYLSLHSEISSDCANPSKWPEILKNDFAIEKDGLHLFPGWERNLQGEYLKYTPEIIIPWNKLLPDMRPELANKIGI